jgi:hypothetical protein
LRGLLDQVGESANRTDFIAIVVAQVQLVRHVAQAIDRVGAHAWVLGKQEHGHVLEGLQLRGLGHDRLGKR